MKPRQLIGMYNHFCFTHIPPIPLNVFEILPLTTNKYWWHRRRRKCGCGEGLGNYGGGSFDINL